ncbi:MAG: hypothetical protein KKC53_01315 [Actinobacteria bacterium]|nr:hypothetical protein [Actinomycetota bacterium]
MSHERCRDSCHASGTDYRRRCCCGSRHDDAPLSTALENLLGDISQ